MLNSKQIQIIKITNFQNNSVVTEYYVAKKKIKNKPNVNMGKMALRSYLTSEYEYL